MRWSNFQCFLERISGSRDADPLSDSVARHVMTRCLFWIAALLIIYFFSGQSSKFIYIDF